MIAGQRAEQGRLAGGIAQGGEDRRGGLDEAFAAHGGMAEAEELAAGAVGLRAFIALGIATECERGGDTEDGVLRHFERLGHRGEGHAFGMPREQLQQIQRAVEDGHLVAAERVGCGFSGFGHGLIYKTRFGIANAHWVALNPVLHFNTPTK